MKFLTFMFPLILMANESTLTFDEIKLIQSSIKKERLITKNKAKKRTKRQPSRKVLNAKSQKELESLRKEITFRKELDKQLLKKPVILSSVVIGEGEYLKATASLGAMATNSQSNLILNNIVGADLPKGSKISCQIVAKYKRVCGVCDRLIIDGQGHDIKADLLNRDGTQCAIGNIADDKELFLTGIAVSELAQGALAISQTSIPTVGGNLIQNTARNKITQGLINTGNEATELMKDEFRTREPIVILPQNSTVLVQFKRRVEL